MKQLLQSSGFGLALLLIPSIANATLGSNENSVQNDKVHISKNATSKTTVNSKYTVHELDSPSNKIREYVDSNGKVFGIAWAGKAHPDLSVLLGSYWSEYSAQIKNQKTVGRRSKIITNNIVVEKGGHMRAISGKAYVLALLPQGVSTNEIK
jgi:hypothetical protein